MQVAGFLLILWISWRYFDKRYRSNGRDPKQSLYGGDFVKTKEIFFDPKDGQKYQVYYHPKTGEREYVRVEE
nr:HD family phosphohydrolase [Paenibacillus sp. MSJ-34]